MNYEFMNYERVEGCNISERMFADSSDTVLRTDDKRMKKRGRKYYSLENYILILIKD